MAGPLPLLQEHFVAQLHQLHDWEQTQLLSSLQRIGEMMNAQHIDAAPVLASGGMAATPEAVVQVTEPPPEDRDGRVQDDGGAEDSPSEGSEREPG
jgi:hypothetical protein